MQKYLCGALAVMLLVSVVACSSGQPKLSLLENMLEQVQQISSYQLEAEMEIDGTTYHIKQWFAAPDKLRTVMSQPTGLEQIVLSSQGNSEAYYSVTREWVNLAQPDSGPFPWGMPLIMLLSEMAKNNSGTTDTFSSVKLAIKNHVDWDSCEIIISKKTKLPDSCTLVKGKESVTLKVSSLVLNPQLSDDLFKAGR